MTDTSTNGLVLTKEESSILFIVIKMQLNATYNMTNNGSNVEIYNALESISLKLLDLIEQDKESSDSKDDFKVGDIVQVSKSCPDSLYAGTRLKVTELGDPQEYNLPTISFHKGLWHAYDRYDSLHIIDSTYIISETDSDERG